ncbi:DUF1127 domain-containing protein [Pacificoceanicola onchidii]|uniref:DUF1127 domain-containing protein n=1 Tax=Pacificoceanicola onchidii TaxID=2562685 RepID=UPI0010A3D951|nr:DUF1127 domain-containing protein [Pacificoceanicola onchidii]
MSTYDVNRHYSTAHSANRLGYFLVGAISMFAAWNDARQTRNSLASLSDRELDDIGLTRADIDEVARRG